MPLRTIPKLDKNNPKTALVRIDSDVDIKNGNILDDTRLMSSLETIKFIHKFGWRVVLMGHLGRPDGKNDSELTLEPIAKWYAKEIGGTIQKTEVEGFPCWKIANNLFILENLRFYKAEEENNAAFAASLALLGNIYVNEAFADSHREHASISKLATLLPSYAGIHFAQEVETLTKVMKNPSRPLVVIIGGAKIETKLPLVEKMHHLADYVLVGGKIAEEERVLIKVQHEKIAGHKSVILVADNTPSGEDITEKDTESFMQILGLGKTIVWNGPVGKMGNPDTEVSTLKIARAIAATGAYTIIGGGDTVTFLKQHHLLHAYSFISTGGGAMLELLSGKELPGIKALEKE